ncbi:MAG TPA: DUF86 domain-containing protein [Methylococcaceae bacterium]|nr:DUF86 domain-containing protein [Methylococcaceae bacterium]
MNDTVINKVQSIERRIRRAREEYRLAGENFRKDFSRQDAAVLNVTRACEQAIDLANHTIRTVKLGVPTEIAESFYLLARAGVIPLGLAEKLKGMVGFRNVAVHEYQKLDLDIVEKILGTGLDDLLELTRSLVTVETNGLAS